MPRGEREIREEEGEREREREKRETEGEGEGEKRQREQEGRISILAKLVPDKNKTEYNK